MLADDSMETELKHRLGEGLIIKGGLVSFWINIRMTIGVKTGILESVVVPTEVYGSRP